MTSDDRIDQFKADLADLKVKSGGGTAERMAGRVGIVMMVAAVIVGIGSYVQSTHAAEALDQNELIVLGFACVAFAIVGSTLFLWTRLVAFWRVWMLRQIYEHQSHIEQLVGRKD